MQQYMLRALKSALLLTGDAVLSGQLFDPDVIRLTNGTPTSYASTTSTES